MITVNFIITMHRKTVYRCNPTRQWPPGCPWIRPVTSLRVHHIPLINRGKSQTHAEGACCSQGPRQRAAGERDRTAGGYGVKASGLKMRGTTRLSHRHLRVKSTLQQHVVPVCKYEEHNYSWLVLGWPNGSGLCNKLKCRKAWRCRLMLYQTPYRPSAWHDVADKCCGGRTVDTLSAVDIYTRPLRAVSV